MRLFLEKFAEDYLHPKVIFCFSLIMIFCGTPYALLADNIAFFKISASMAGIVGTILSARRVIRKGFAKIVYESRHNDWGDVSPTKSKEDWNTEWDAEAQAMGVIVILFSAFIIFLVEIVEF